MGPSARGSWLCKSVMEMHTLLPRHVSTVLSSTLHSVFFPVCPAARPSVSLSVCPSLLQPGPVPRSQGPRGWAAGGTAISTWCRKHPHRPGPGTRATCGLSRFGLCPGAWEPGSPRSHAKDPGLAPSFLGFVRSTVPQHSPRHEAREVPPAGPCQPRRHLGAWASAADGWGGGKVPARHVGTWAKRLPACY